MRVVAALGSAILAFVLAKFSDPNTVGSFYIILTLSLGGSIIARNGCERSIVRFLPRLGEKNIGEVSKFNLLLLNGRVLSIRLTLISFLFIPFYFFTPYFNEVPYHFYIIFTVVLSYSTLLSGFHKGAYRPSTAILFEVGIISLITAVALIVGYHINGTISAAMVYWAFSLSGCVIFLIYVFSNLKIAKRIHRTGACRSYSVDKAFLQQRSVSSSFMLMTLVVYLQQLTIVWVLGVLISPEQLAVYKVSEKIAVTIGFFQSVIAAVYAPFFARYSNNRDFSGLRKSFYKSLAIGLSLAVPPLVVISLFSEEILSYFGEGFISGASVLVALSFAQVGNVIFGQPALALNMSGYEYLTRNIIVAVSLCSVPLAYWLSSHYGILGASMAMVISTYSHNFICFLFFIRLLRMKERL